jgi:hypothetical protein
MDDFIVNNEKKKHSSYGMKNFIPYDECFLHFIINNVIIPRFWDSVGARVAFSSASKGNTVAT